METLVALYNGSSLKQSLKVNEIYMVSVAPEECDDVKVENGGLGNDNGAGGAAEKSVIEDLAVANGRQKTGLLLGLRGHLAEANPMTSPPHS